MRDSGDLRKQEMPGSSGNLWEAAAERRARAHCGDTGCGNPVSSGNVPSQQGTLVQEDRTTGRHSRQPAFCLHTSAQEGSSQGMAGVDSLWPSETKILPWHTTSHSNHAKRSQESQVRWSSG